MILFFLNSVYWLERKIKLQYANEELVNHERIDRITDAGAAEITLKLHIGGNLFLPFPLAGLNCRALTLACRVGLLP